MKRLIGLPGFLLAASALAQPAATPTPVQPLTLERESFQITDAQWSRYQTLMKGEAGLYYRDLSPVWVLGIYATTPVERQRYAELAAKQEKARLDKLLAFNRAWIEASDKTMPGSPIDGQLAKQRKQALRQMTSLSQLLRDMKKPAAPRHERIALFTRSGCPACDTLLPKLLGTGKALDIYLLDSAGKDAVIRQWAKAHAIPKDRVSGRAGPGSITLNHDAGTLGRLMPNASAPALFVREGNRYKPVSAQALGL